MQRAVADLACVAIRPHPAGSAAHAEVRDHIAGQLRCAGFRVRAKPDFATRLGSGSTVVAGRVVNVHAALPADHGTDRIVLVAHYDSALDSPGASDDGVGVVAILELARHLARRAPRRNRIEVLFTDAEEAGLLGAAAFVAAEAADAAGAGGRTVVLNVDARGTSGRLVMFECGNGSAALVTALRRRPPTATSLAESVYRSLPNNTDFTVFREAGWGGLNFAIVGGSARYHTAADDIDHAQPEVIADIGAVLGSAVDALADLDLQAVDPHDRTYFTALGHLCSYRRPAEIAIAVAGLCDAIAAASRGGRAGTAAHARLSALVLAPVAAAGLAAAGGWRAARAARPHHRTFSSGDSYRPALTHGGIATVSVGLAVLGYTALRRWYSADQVAEAIRSVLAVGGAALAVARPGTSYLIAVPAAVGSAARPAGPRIAAAATAAPLVALAAPLLRLLFPALGAPRAAAPAALTALAATAAVAALDPPRRTATASGAALVAAGAAIWLGGTLRERITAREPAQVSLVYAMDADLGLAHWLSTDARPHPWIGAHVPHGPDDVGEVFPGLHGISVRSGDAPRLDGQAPAIDVLDVRTRGAETEIRIRVRAPALFAPIIEFYAGADDAELAGITVDGHPTDDAHRTDEHWPRALRLAAIDRDVCDLTLNTVGTGSLRLRAVANMELPERLLPSPRPATLMWSPRHGGRAYVATGVSVNVGVPEPR